MDDATPLFQDTPSPAGDWETQSVLQPSPIVPTKPIIPSRSRLWVTAIGVIMTGLIGLLIFNAIRNKPPAPEVVVIQAPTATPTPVRLLSAIATQSAFVALNQTHASLSAGLTATNLDDPILSPPVLELPLGFKP